MTTTSHAVKSESTPAVTAATSHAAGSDSKSIWAAVRDTYRERRSAREFYSRLERELATYTSPSDLAELDAMIERSDVEDGSVYSGIIERVRLRAA